MNKRVVAIILLFVALTVNIHAQEPEQIPESPAFVSAFNKGNDALNSGDAATAIVHFRRATEISPNNPIAWKWLGLSYQIAGRAAPALVALRKSVELDNNQADLHFFIGKILFDTKKFDEALESFSESARLEPESYRGQYGISITLASLERHVEALDAIEQTIQIAEKEALLADEKQKEFFEELLLTFYQNKGAIALKLDRFDQAIEAFRKLTESLPDQPENFDQLGKAYLAKGDAEQAADAFKKAIQLDPNKSEFYYNLGNAFAADKKLDLALENFKKASELNPTDHWAIYSMAQIYTAKQEFETALELYRKALKLNPTNPAANRAFGYVTYLLGNFEDALKVLKFVESLEENNVTTMTILGDILSDMGDFAEALKYYKTVLEKAPKTENISAKIDSVVKLQALRTKAGRTLEEARKLMKLDSSEPKTSKHYIIKSDASPELTEVALELAEKIHNKCLEYFQVPDFTEKCEITFFNTRQAYREFTRQNHPTLVENRGFYNSGKKQIVLFKTPGPLMEDLKTVLAHEIVHYFMREKFKTDAPVWLHEGCAEYFQLSDFDATPLAPGAKNPERVIDMKQAIYSGAYKSFNDFFSMPENAFHGPRKSALYAQSYTIVLFLFETMKTKFENYLNTLKNTDRTLERHWEAFIKENFESIQDFHEKWKSFVLKL